MHGVHPEVFRQVSEFAGVCGQTRCQPGELQVDPGVLFVLLIAKHRLFTSDLLVEPNFRHAKLKQRRYTRPAGILAVQPHQANQRARHPVVVDGQAGYQRRVNPAEPRPHIVKLAQFVGVGSGRGEFAAHFCDLGLQPWGRHLLPFFQPLQVRDAAPLHDCAGYFNEAVTLGRSCDDSDVVQVLAEVVEFLHGVGECIFPTTIALECLVQRRALERLFIVLFPNPAVLQAPFAAHEVSGPVHKARHFGLRQVSVLFHILSLLRDDNPSITFARRSLQPRLARDGPSPGWQGSQPGGSVAETQRRLVNAGLVLVVK